MSSAGRIRSGVAKRRVVRVLQCVDTFGPWEAARRAGIEESSVNLYIGEALKGG